MHDGRAVRARALSRPALFYLTLGSFMAFFGLFGFLLFPNVAALHSAPGGALDRARARLRARVVRKCSNRAI